MILREQIYNSCHDLTKIKKLIIKTREQTLNLWEQIFLNNFSQSTEISLSVSS